MATPRATTAPVCQDCKRQYEPAASDSPGVTWVHACRGWSPGDVASSVSEDRATEIAAAIEAAGLEAVMTWRNGVWAVRAEIPQL